MSRELDIFNEDDFDFGDGEDFSSPDFPQEELPSQPPKPINRRNVNNIKPQYDNIQSRAQTAEVETVVHNNTYTGGHGDINQQQPKPVKRRQQSGTPNRSTQQSRVYTVDELKAMVNNRQMTMDEARAYMEKHGLNKPVEPQVQQPVQQLQQPVQTYTYEQLQTMVNNGQMSLEEAQAILNRQNELAQSQRPAKKKSKLPIIIVLLLVAIVGVFVVKSKSKKPEVVVQPTFSFDSSTFDTFQQALNEYDAQAIDTVVGAEEGDSWLAQEWSYANLDADRQDFIKSVCKVVKFEYPESEDDDLQVTIPDYTEISNTALADVEYIQKLYKASGYAETDYTYYEEMYELALYYIEQKYNGELPTTTVVCDLEANNGIIVDDVTLDDLLFGSDEWHTYLDSFQKSVTGWTGYTDEIYYEKEMQLNPEYDEWFDIFIKYYEADGGTYDKETDTLSGGRFDKRKSKWEPWFKRAEDDPDKILVDENGEKIVNYYSVKMDDGTDWIQPDRYVEVDVEKVRKIDDPFIPEDIIRYGYLGAHWISTNICDYDTSVQIGNGTIEHPAGIGTTLITQLLGTDGIYHDVKVTLTGYWVGQDAIDYAIEFSDKNRGLVSDSVIQLICFEYKLENLESEDFEFEAGEFCLMNSSSSKSSRTGTMYGFKQGGVLKSREPELFNDWYSSTELQHKYLCWGSSFNRKFPVLYFMVLAGDGNVPTYSAYNQFTKVKDEQVEQVQPKDVVQEKEPVSEDSVESEDGAESTDSEESKDSETKPES